METAEDNIIGGLSVFYGLFLTMAGFAASLTPVLIDGPEFYTRVYILGLLFDAYVYIVASGWLLFLFIRILNNATFQPSRRQRKASQITIRNHRKTSNAVSHLNNVTNGGIVNTSFEVCYNANMHVPPMANGITLSTDVQSTEKSQESPSNDAKMHESDVPGHLPTITSNGVSNGPSQNNQGDASDRETVGNNATIGQIQLSNPAYQNDSYPTHVTTTEKPTSSGLQQNARFKQMSMAHVTGVHLSTGEAASPSFYLRIGAVAFGIGTVTSVVFYILAKAEAPFRCSDYDILSSVIEVLLAIVRVFFLFAQTFFIFKHSKLSVLKWQQWARFGQMHLIATNLNDWFETVVKEAVHSSQYSASSYSSSTNKTTAASVTTQAVGNFSSASFTSTVTPYSKAKCNNPLYELYSDSLAYFAPLIIEYSLIAAVSSYIIYHNVGVGARVAPSMNEAMRKVARTRFSVDCSKSIRGLFAGIITLVLSVVVLIMSLSNQPYKVILYYGAIDVLVIAALIGTIIAFISIRKLSKAAEVTSSRRATPDAILLMVSLSGALLSAVFVLIGTLGQSNVTLCVLEVIWAVLTMLQSIAQVFLISFSESRCCETREEQHKLPGRGAVLFLLLANFSLWIAHSFVSRDVVINSEVVPLYNNVSYQVVLSATLPLLIFCRFHSTACLSEVWRNVYSIRREHH